jgi:hypothetical protein
MHAWWVETCLLEEVPRHLIPPLPWGGVEACDLQSITFSAWWLTFCLGGGSTGGGGGECAFCL